MVETQEISGAPEMVETNERGLTVDLVEAIRMVEKTVTVQTIEMSKIVETAGEYRW